MNSLIQAFMLTLVTSIFGDDSMKNEEANMEMQFSHYKSMEFFFLWGELKGS